MESVSSLVEAHQKTYSFAVLTRSFWATSQLVNINGTRTFHEVIFVYNAAVLTLYENTRVRVAFISSKINCPNKLLFWSGIALYFEILVTLLTPAGVQRNIQLN